MTGLDVTKYTRRSNLREGEFFLATVPGDNAHPEEKALGSSRVTRVSPIIDAATGSRDQAGSGAGCQATHLFQYLNVPQPSRTAPPVRDPRVQTHEPMEEMPH